MKRERVEDNKKVVAKKRRLDLGKELVRACDEGDIKAVKLLLHKKACVNAKDEWGWTPLHDACLEGHTTTVKLLLHKKADAGVKDHDEWTPLHSACRGGHAAIVRLLLDKKASVGANDEGGLTPLHWACAEGYTPVVMVLLDKKASVDAKDGYGDTPLDYACTNKELVQLLKTNDERQRLIMVKWMKRHLSTIFNKGSQYDTTGLVSPFLTICSQYM